MNSLPSHVGGTRQKNGDSWKPSCAAAQTAPRRPVKAWLPLAVIGVTIAVYANSLSGVFLLDDQRYIIDNLRIRELAEIGEVLSHRRPMLDLSLAINYALGGLDVRGYHIVNVLIHTMAALVLLGVVHRTLRGKRFSHGVNTAASYPALVVALLWAVHPLQTQSVTYVIQRSESLMGLFYLLTLYCVIRGAHAQARTTRSTPAGTAAPALQPDQARPSGGPRGLIWYTAAVASCAAGMASKAVMVTAPVLVLLYDRAFLAESFSQMLRRRWALYLGLALGLVVLVVCGVAGGVLSTSHQRATVGFSFAGLTPGEYARSQPGVLMHYLSLSLWPNPLCLDYRWPVAKTAAAMLPPAAVIAGLLGLVVWGLVRRSWLGFAGASFFLVLAPTSSVIPIRDVAFEHRMYLPLAAVIVVAVAGAYAWLDYVCQRAPVLAASWMKRWITVGLVVVAVFVLAAGTVRRNETYQSALSMWQDVVKHRPNNARAYSNLAAALDAAGDRVGATRAVQKALQLDPQDATAHANLGKALVDQGRVAEGIEHLRTALALNPKLGNALRNLGVALVQAGRLDEAITVFRRATKGDEFLADAHFNLGAALLQKGEIDLAIRECRSAIRIDPSRHEAHFNLALALRAKGDVEQEIASLKEAARLAPENARIWFILGQELLRADQREEALAAFEETLAIEPDHVLARQALTSLRNR